MADGVVPHPRTITNLAKDNGEDDEKENVTCLHGGVRSREREKQGQFGGNRSGQVRVLGQG